MFWCCYRGSSFDWFSYEVRDFVFIVVVGGGFCVVLVVGGWCLG